MASIIFDRLSEHIQKKNKIGWQSKRFRADSSCSQYPAKFSKSMEGSC